MTLFRPLAAVFVLFATTSAAFADAAPADMANATACQLDRVREIIAGAVQHGADDEETNRLIVENTADWLPDYAAFATGPEATDLSAALSALPERLSAAQCRQFLPLAAVSASAERISKAGADVPPGAVLIPCEGSDGLCLPAPAARVITQCGSALFSLPLQSTC